MFLRDSKRVKDGKVHRYYSLVENQRVKGGRVVQHTVLYLGEINDAQKEAWIRATQVFDEDQGRVEQLNLFAAAPSEAPAQALPEGVQVRLREFSLHRPRQWGGCWLFTELWNKLGLREFWRPLLGTSREGADWEHVLQLLACYRLLDPGSEWRLHRAWFDSCAMGELLGEDFSIAAKDTLYRCLDRLVPHKQALFSHLRGRWENLFGAKFEVLLYDLTSTYFESDPPFAEGDKRQFGYSRDKRSDCVQVVIALVLTPEGFPLAYEVLPGHTADKTTLRGFLQRIEDQYGKADRIWLMDRGIPTEEVLAEMRAADPPVHYLVGTPKGRLGKLEAQLLPLDWQSAREGVEVKLLPKDNEIYVLAKSRDRVGKERGMRRRQLKGLWKRLGELQRMAPKRDELLLKLGAAQGKYPAAWRLVSVAVSAAGELHYSLIKSKLRQVIRREGRYLLRTNLQGPDADPARLWHMYMLLAQVEEAFKNLKGDLAVRPIHHQLEHRIEAHIFVAFLAFCLHATLRHQLRIKAPGLTPRAVFEQLNQIQLIDVHFPTTCGRTLIFQRYTAPDKLQQLLLHQMELTLPEQSPPRLTSERAMEKLN